MTRIEFLRQLLMSMTPGVDHTYFGYAGTARGEDKRHLVVTAYPDHPSFFTSSDLTSLRSVSGSKRAELRSRTSRSGGDSRRASSNLLGLRGKAASIPRFKAVSEILLLNKRSSTAARTLLVTFASVLYGWVSSHILPAGGAVSYTGEKIEGASRRAKAHQGDALQLHAILEASSLGTSAGARRVAAGDGDEPRAALAARAHHRLCAN